MKNNEILCDNLRLISFYIFICFVLWSNYSMKYYTVDYCSVGIDEEDYKKLKKVLEGDNPTIEEQDFFYDWVRDNAKIDQIIWDGEDNE